MKLILDDDKLEVKFNILEIILSFKRVLKIPLEHITKVSIDKPSSSLFDIRMPGTFIPKIVRAGTYYTRRGKEFWYVIKFKNYLILELCNESYKRIILNIDDNKRWRDRIEKCAGGGI